MTTSFLILVFIAVGIALLTYKGGDTAYPIRFKNLGLVRPRVGGLGFDFRILYDH